MARDRKVLHRNRLVARDRKALHRNQLVASVLHGDRGRSNEASRACSASRSNIHFVLPRASSAGLRTAWGHEACPTESQSSPVPLGQKDRRDYTIFTYCIYYNTFFSEWRNRRRTIAVRNGKSLRLLSCHAFGRDLSLNGRTDGHTDRPT